MSKAMRFVGIKVSQLLQFAEENAQTLNIGLVPVIRSRARSLAENPYADPEDLALILTYQDDRIVAYIGMIATYYYHNGCEEKIFWGCTAAVVKEHWGTHVSDDTLNFAKANLHAFCGGGASVNAQKVYVRNEFLSVKVKPMIKINICLFRIPGKRTVSHFLNKCLKPFLRGKSFEWRDSACKRIGAMISKRIGQVRARDLGRQELNADLSPYVEAKLNIKKENSFCRSPEVVRWMLKTPWWPGEPIANETEQRYHFYEKEKRINYKVFELYDNKAQPIGFALFAIIQVDTITVKLLDHANENAKAREAIIRLGFQIVAQVRADQILFPFNFFKQSSLRYLIPFRKTVIEDNYCVWSKDAALMKAMTKVNAQMTDGDIPFW